MLESESSQKRSRVDKARTFPIYSHVCYTPWVDDVTKLIGNVITLFSMLWVFGFPEKFE